MQLSRIRVIVVLALAVFLTAAALPTVKPEEVGLSSERLQRINHLVQRYIDDGQITGAITMVSRRGKIAHFLAHPDERRAVAGRARARALREHTYGHRVQQVIATVGL